MAYPKPLRSRIENLISDIFITINFWSDVDFAVSSHLISVVIPLVAYLHSDHMVISPASDMSNKAVLFCTTSRGVSEKSNKLYGSKWVLTVRPGACLAL